MLKRIYYFTLLELDEDFGGPTIQAPFNSGTLKSFLDDTIGSTNYSKLNTSVSDTNVEKLWQEIIARYFDHYMLKIELRMNQDINDYDSSELENKFIKWIWKFLSLLDQTSPYYLALLTAYAAAESHLMDDITATSGNTIKYNDTPQNANTSGIYEGDDYITNFTSTTGTTSSPLMSKIMRLKEIQDSYKRVMADWVKEFERLWFERSEEDD